MEMGQDVGGGEEVADAAGASTAFEQAASRPSLSPPQPPAPQPSSPLPFPPPPPPIASPSPQSIACLAPQSQVLPASPPPKPPRSVHRKPAPSWESVGGKPQDPGPESEASHSQLAPPETAPITTPQQAPDPNPRLNPSHSLTHGPVRDTLHPTASSSPHDRRSKDKDDLLLKKPPSIREARARDSLDLAQRRWSPLFDALSEDLGEGPRPEQPANDSNPETNLHACGHEAREASSVSLDPSTGSSDSAQRRSSRARTQPGYVHSARSPPSSVKGPFEADEAHLAYLARGLSPMPTTTPTPTRRPSLTVSMSAISPPITPLSSQSSSLPGSYPIPAHTPPPPPPPPQPNTALPPVSPSLRALHTLMPTRTRIAYLLPSLTANILAALVQPFVSSVIGDTFGALAAFPAGAATPAQKAELLRVVGGASFKLVGAGAVYALCEYAGMVGWTHYGETGAAYLRARVYHGVRSKPMAWYDTGMGMGDNDSGGSGGGPADAVGSGGLMGKFARETDDVRIGTSQATGLFVQSLASFFACFVLALIKLPTLALVTMSSLPLLAALNAGTGRVAFASQVAERRAFAEASTIAERTAAAIATVKAHNAQAAEERRFGGPVTRARVQLVRQAIAWGQCLAFSDGLCMLMFIVGFWYGAILINAGKAGVAEVMTVFFACLLGAAQLQGAPPQYILINKGKASLASLLSVIQEGPAPPSPTRTLPRLRGEFEFKRVFFAYPSRPHQFVLRGIDLFLPCGEMTFIVGGSGSGKSTVAHLLLRLYEAGAGDISLDEHTLSSFDRAFTDGHVAAVSQGCLIFDMSVHDNVAMGVLGADASTYGRVRRPEEVTRGEVVDACRLALVHDFIVSLPQGYDTMLGSGGSALSGGQKQRLAIARARLRDPAVLILDEATAALDATSRVEVFEAMRAWRKNSTTIVITHDLSQITPGDFVYVMQDGAVVQQGFRRDLTHGVFAAMAAEQSAAPLEPKLDFSWRAPEEDSESETDDVDELARIHTTTWRMSVRPSPAPAKRVRPSSSVGRGRTASVVVERERRESAVSPPLSPAHSPKSGLAMPLKLQLRRSGEARRSVERRSADVRWSVEPTTGEKAGDKAEHFDLGADVDGAGAPPSPRHSSLAWQAPPDLKVRGFFRLMHLLLPSIPHKSVLLFGTMASIARGVATPTWSFFLAQLMALLGKGTNAQIAHKSGILIAITVTQALIVLAQHASLASLGAVWTARLRAQTYGLVLCQDKGWFDREENSPPRLVQGLIKDVDDMRHLVATVLPRILVAAFMVGLGFIWALAVGWQLTLVGLAMLPVFAGLGVASTILLSRAEVYNKARREAVSRLFFEAVANVRGIRAMALEQSFTQRFVAESFEARRHAQRAIWTTAMGTSLNMAMPLFAQALLNYVGAIFIRNGTMSLVDMLKVYTLVLFSVTFAVGLLGFLPLLTKAKVAAADFERLRTLPSCTSDGVGTSVFPITGHIAFSHVSFRYPTRPGLVLRDFNLSLSPGEAVAVVGPSGSGKSTLAALLQRLYAPSSGSITLGGHDLARADIRRVRDAIAIVSQTPHLFDASVAENIRYGGAATQAEIEAAARTARIHDFIAGLPQGYDTRLGEDAALVSGGQAQRLQIARAVVRRAKILVLDEATSALDGENQAGIVDTILGVKENHTTIFITHSVEVMRRCDRVVCLGDGRVAEDGTYAELIARGGVFAQLLKTGEWQ